MPGAGLMSWDSWFGWHLERAFKQVLTQRRANGSIWFSASSGVGVCCTLCIQMACRLTWPFQAPLRSPALGPFCLLLGQKSRRLADLFPWLTISTRYPTCRFSIKSSHSQGIPNFGKTFALHSIIVYGSSAGPPAQRDLAAAMELLGMKQELALCGFNGPLGNLPVTCHCSTQAV